MKLLCDEMLYGLGRSLRAAGYDTAIAAPGLPDVVLLDQAELEDRIVLTCDRSLAAGARSGQRVIVLATARLEPAAAELRGRLGIDWLHRPFTRCLIDNSPLRAASDAEVRALPPETRDGTGPFTTCPGCGRVFWPGSHVRRMQTRLERWQAAG
jgi:uncharacterized protein